MNRLPLAPTLRLGKFLPLSCFLLPGALIAQSLPEELPDLPWHLTARPWEPTNLPVRPVMIQMERALRAMASFQYWNDSDPNDPKNGAIIDPFDNKEVQYGTPLFAFNVSLLVSRSNATDLLDAAARAMDRATKDISDGMATDSHGEFFVAPLMKTITLLEPLAGKHPLITPERVSTWKERMKTKRESFMELRVKQNWRTFAMKGEWLRQKAGYIEDATPWIEANWKEASEGGQRERLRRDLDQYHLKPHFFLYHDDTADPETFAYNGAVSSNLLAMLEDGYDGPSAPEMRKIISHNLRSSLFLLGASGESPAGGRTGDHTWNDTVYSSAFSMMAEGEKRNGNERLAGQFRRAVQLLIANQSPIQQDNGLFSITKNHFPPALKNRYASWSAVANYEGYMLAGITETLLSSRTPISTHPLPSEIGGYVVEPDPEFSSTFVNAGGMQLQICNRGETDNYGGVQWHALGINRFSRSGWNGRLGPGAGHVDSDFKNGATFSPTFMENGEWKRVCMEPDRFQGAFKATFVHPVLTRGIYTVSPQPGKEGPTFEMAITITPDGALIDTSRVSTGEGAFGVIWPLLEFDGRTILDSRTSGLTASTRYPRFQPDLVSTFETSEATLSGDASIASDGFTGSVATGAASLEWKKLPGGETGETIVSFVYSLPGAKDAIRKAKLTINDEPSRELVFFSTGKDKLIQRLELPVSLKSGGEKNTIRLDLEPGSSPLLFSNLYLKPVSAETPANDQQNFIALDDEHRLDATAPVVRGGYGDLRPVLVSDLKGKPVQTFVYPRSAGDPEAEAVRTSFKREGEDFSSILGSVKGTLYTGRTSAGGVGSAIDIDRDGKDDATFSKSCSFIVQIREGRITAVEADQAVTVTIGEKQVELQPHQPVEF